MYEYNSRILRVVDGDTIDVDIDLGFGITMVNQRIRLQGVDTPESRTRDLEEKKFGLLAWLMLSNALVDGGFAVQYHGQSKEEIKEAHFFNREKVRGLLAE